MIKKLIQNQPKFGDLSQYNFENQNDGYNKSLGLPKNTDKFTDKDLYTNQNPSIVNELIIDYNVKFSGESFINIDKLTINNSGISHDIKNIRVQCYIFSQEAFILHTDNNNQKIPEECNYSELSDILYDSPFTFYNSSFGDKTEGRSLGSILENKNIVTNISDVSGTAEDKSENVNIGDVKGTKLTTPLTTGTNPPFLLRGSQLINSIIDAATDNPIYIAVYMKGDADRWWGTDKRKKRIQVYKLDNQELFQSANSGDIKYYDNPAAIMNVTGGGGSGWAEAAAFKVSDIQFTFNTNQATPNTLIDDQEAVTVQIPFHAPEDFLTSTFVKITPNSALNNTSANTTTTYKNKFKEFQVYTTFNIKDLDGNLQSEDLQSYYEDDIIKSFKASAPAEVGMSLDIVRTSTSNTNRDEFVYFVVDWDDNENKLATLEDWLISTNRPINLYSLLNSREGNIYIPEFKNGNVDNGFFETNLSHTYTTPGIKTIKMIVFSYDPNNKSTGRWKLVTSRIFLDIPINQFPDFGELGAEDFTTIPWPYITPIIGGIDENSKYNKSLNTTLGSGKIGNTDIIDERFLVRAIENDELGDCIEKMDLEQFRYFNKPYSMNNLLQIPLTIISTDTSPIYLEGLPFPQYLEEFHIFREIDDESPDNWAPANWQGWIDVGRPDIAAYMEYASSIEDEDNPFPDEYTYPDYIYDVQLWFVDIPIGNGAEQEVSVFFNPTDNSPYYGNPYDDFDFWNGSVSERTFSEESSVGQIFISDNLDVNLKDSCQLEINTGNLVDKSIYDSSGNSNKGLMIGDYKIKKIRKGEPMRRDTFIKFPKKASKRRGAL